MKDLEFWEDWLTSHGYSIDFDKDGIWAESWIQEHKWIDVFELMSQFASEVMQDIGVINAEIAERLSKYSDDKVIAAVKSYIDESELTELSGRENILIRIALERLRAFLR